jgi:hypothetical protein
MSLLNIGRGNFFTATLAEQLAGDVNQRYTLMPGRFSLARQILNNPLLSWMQAMEDKYSGWLDMMLPSLHTGTLLPQLFSRLRQEMALAPFAFSWFDRDWLRYVRSHGMYLPEGGKPGIDRPTPIDRLALPLESAGTDLFNGPVAEDAPAGSTVHRLPYTSHATLLTGELLRLLEARRSGGLAQPGRKAAIQSGQYVQLPESETGYQRIFAVHAPEGTELPFISPQAIEQNNTGLPLLNLFHPAQPFSIEQAIFNKYLAAQPGVIPQQRLAGIEMAIPQQPAMGGFLQDSSLGMPGRSPHDALPDKIITRTPLAGPQPAATEYSRYENTAPEEGEDALPIFSDEGPVDVKRFEQNRTKGKSGRRERPFDFTLPGTGSDPYLPLPVPDADFDLFSLSFGLPAAKDGSPSPALAGMIPGAGFAAGPAASLPHAPAAFVQRKASSPGEQQETQEQAPARQGGAEDAGAGPDVEALAVEIYEILRRRIAIEQERLQGSTR